VPLLPAAGYTTPVAPTIEPSPTSLTPYQEIRAPAEAFGAGTAQALSGLGTSFEKASANLESMISFHDQVVVDEQKNFYDDFVNKKLYGDPNSPGDVGYMGLQGKNALEAREGVRKDLDNIRMEQRSKLTNAHQLVMFDQETSRLRNIALGAVGRHYDEQYNKHTAETAKAGIELAAHGASVASSNNDFGEFKNRLTDAITGVEIAGKARGDEQATIDLAKTNVIKGFTVDWAAKAILRNPVEGRAFIKAHPKELGDKYDELLGHAERAAHEYDVNELANGRPPTMSQPNLVRGGASGNAVERFLDMTALHESGWRNIPQGIVGPGGGYNSSTGTVTGPSSAQGYYQITNSTWKTFAPAAGVDINKYPNAMSAPPEVQRQVARQIVTTSGVQHWTDYNRNLRTAAISVGFPTSGPIIESGGSTAPAQPAASAGAEAPVTPATPVPGMPPVSAPSAPEEEEPITAGGDSLSSHMVRAKVAVGQEDRTKVGSYRPGDTAVAGWDSTQILRDLIPKLPRDKISGKTVAWSTGVSNEPDAAAVQKAIAVNVPLQIALLKAQNAKNIVIMGVGPAEKLKGANEALEKVAKENDVLFAGPQRAPRAADPEKLHSGDQKAEIAAVREALHKEALRKAPKTAPPTPEAGVQTIATGLRQQAVGAGKPLTIREIATASATPETADAKVDAAVKHTGFAPDQPLDLSKPEVMKKAVEVVVLGQKGKVTSEDTQTIMRGLTSKPVDTVVPTVGQLPKVSNMPILPPLEPNELPDGQVPGLQQRLEAAAKVLPANAPPKLWNDTVRKIRQEENAKYTANLHVERMKDIAQKRADEEIGNEYYKRVTPGAANRPTEEEVLADTRISQEKRKDIIGIMRSMEKPDPHPSIAANEMVEANKRMGLEDGDSNKITQQSQLDDLYNNKKITWDMKTALSNKLKELNDATTANVNKHVTQLLKDAERTLFPLKHLKNDAGVMSDPGGPMRERAYQFYVDSTVKDWIKAGKNPMELFDPGPPEKPNPNYLGRQSVLDYYGKGAQGYASLPQNNELPDPAKREFKKKEEVAKAFQDGRFGDPNTQIAIDRATAYLVATGLGKLRPPAPSSPVPVR